MSQNGYGSIHLWLSPRFRQSLYIPPGGNGKHNGTCPLSSWQYRGRGEGSWELPRLLRWRLGRLGLQKPSHLQHGEAWPRESRTKAVRPCDQGDQTRASGKEEQSGGLRRDSRFSCCFSLMLWGLRSNLPPSAAPQQDLQREMGEPGAQECPIESGSRSPKRPRPRIAPPREAKPKAETAWPCTEPLPRCHVRVTMEKIWPYT